MVWIHWNICISVTKFAVDFTMDQNSWNLNWEIQKYGLLWKFKPNKLNFRLLKACDNTWKSLSDPCHKVIQLAMNWKENQTHSLKLQTISVLTKFNECLCAPLQKKFPWQCQVDCQPVEEMDQNQRVRTKLDQESTNFFTLTRKSLQKVWN